MSMTEPAAPRSRTSTTLLAIVALLATFCVGVLVGVAADRVFIMRGMHRPAGRSAEFMTKRLDRRLDLSPQQERQVAAIIERGQQRMFRVWGNVHPQIRQEIERTNAEIAQILTPEQRAKFDQVKMRMAPRHRGPRP